MASAKLRPFLVILTICSVGQMGVMDAGAGAASAIEHAANGMHLVAFGPRELSPLERAQEALDSGQGKVAEALFRELLQENPMAPVVLVGWSRALHLQGRGPEAAGRLDAAIGRWLKQDSLDAAEGGLRLLAEIRPDDSDVFAKWGEALVRQRKFASAEPTLRRAAELAPRAPLFLLLGSVLWENGSADEAGEVFRRVGESDVSRPVAAAGWTQLGRLEVWRNEPEAALEAFDRASDAGAAGIELRLERARALAQLAEEDGSDTPAHLDEALEIHRALTAELPQASQIRYRYARLLAKQGDRASAKREMAAYGRLVQAERLRTQEDGADRSRVAAARKHLREDRPDRALEALQGLDSSTAVEPRALALLQLGRHSEARRLLEAELQASPARTELRALLARALSGR